MRAMTVPIVAGAAACILGIAAGAELPTGPQTEALDARSFSQLASAKFERGVVNIVTGWCELIRCPISMSESHGALAGATLGVGKGIAMGIIRTVGGVFEAALFCMPPPDNYAPFFKSPTVFDNWPHREPAG